jgi:hypothetical protein
MPNIKDKSKPTITDKDRMTVESTTPSAGLTNVSAADNSKVLMGAAAGLEERGWRADQLVEMAGEDGNDNPPGNRETLLSTEIRKTKMKG